MTAPTVSYTRNPGPRQYAQGIFSGTYTAASDVSTTTNSTMASGVITLTLGFVPRYFKIINVTDRVTQEWFTGMNSGDYLETAAAGTRTLETDDKLVVAIRTGTGAVAGTSSGGSADTTASGVVTVTVDSGIMTDNDTVVWVAEG